MSAKLILTVFLAAVALGNALRCHTCFGSEDSDCHKGIQSEFVTRNCSALLPSQKVGLFMPQSINNKAKLVEHCLHITYKNISGAVPAFKSPYSYRYCGFFEEGMIDVCDFVSQAPSVKHCMSCEKDLCNNKPGGSV